ncbi:hypothetical protein L249_8031 [Ophiocordyceps polyrhachis-furcata BCC 54312]|uniref:Signal peptidase complex subunit 2 n=1 Tax=Ophiocordyceps polyrhachis-furcata BCC 54312 TaxID=1330021 RepID=A0A367LHZ4_9HYPO|nr:hypothetical protein L249_8031 [Ophiocordyceps polyrhachis-furcata BCC 54312]
MASPEKISVYNLANTSDDALPNYLNSLRFKQSHFLTDVRLALGYGAFAIAAAAFLWDYRFGFDDTKLYTSVAVAVYAVVNSALTFWLTRVEKGVVYQGVSPSGDELSIATATTRNDPTYRLTISVNSRGKDPQVINLAAPFASFFDETGRFVVKPFQELLASSVPVIGKLDPKRASSINNNKLASQDLLNADPGLLDAVLAAEPATATTSSSADAKTGGKRRKSAKQ